MSDHVRAIAERSKDASRAIASLPDERKNLALATMADLLQDRAAAILEANRQDYALASGLLASGGISASTLERLRLTERTLADMAHSVRAVAALADPVGRVLARTALDDDLILEQVTCPLGVLAVIFEARPDAVTQIAALALKSSNAVILKPGTEVDRTSSVLVDTLRVALARCALPEDIVSLVHGRAAAQELLGLTDLVDLVIPRGSKALVEYVQSATRIPVLGHSEGVCHVYVDAAADPAMALDIIDDAKTDYPAACNAVETVLVHEAIARTFLPQLASRLRAKGVRLRGCDRTRAILANDGVEPVAGAEWHTEYADLVLAIRVVRDVTDAIAHIHRYGSGHTESIVTGDRPTAERFLTDVDAAGVYHNASTRFADGYRYGFGAEVGISTGKLHARGPVGVDGLTTSKYVLRGHGHVARAYRGNAGRTFKHERLPL